MPSELSSIAESNAMDLIVNLAPTGMIPTKAMTPFVPVSVNEIAEEIHSAVEVGITMVHLHARDESSGLPVYQKEIYGRIIEAIRAFSKDLVICVSTSGRTFKTFDERSDALRLEGDCKPDMGSLTLSSLNFNRIASLNEPQMIKDLASEMLSRGILPELEAFDTGMLNYAKYLQKKSLIAPPLYINLLLGNIACAQADLLHAGVMINDLPPDTVWSLGGIGNSQLPMNAIAISIGGGVRIGIEDNIWYDNARTRLATNMDLLRRIHCLADVNERKIMSAENLRKLLNLQAGYGKYGRKPSYK